MMNFQNVCLESLGYTLPEEVVTTAEIENRLAPTYERLRLPEGRLETMTGIRERRFYAPGTKPSDISVESANRAIEAAGIDYREVGMLIHGSVCRDHLEPATACRVHHLLGLSSKCMIYDVSNACLGILNGAVQAAAMIELGMIRAAVVVGTECGRSLVENTIASLNANESLTRASVKPAIASLTIGSASCAMVLVHRDISQTHNELTAAAVQVHSEHHNLCQSSGGDQAIGAGDQPLMATDSEKLLHEGVAAGAETFKSFLEATSWSPSQIDKTVCHQVGAAHRKMLLDTLALNEEDDFSTFEYLGNTGSAALPTALAIAAEKEFIASGDNVGLFGIGSGINCLMLSVEWQKSLIGSQPKEQDEVVQFAT